MSPWIVACQAPCQWNFPGKNSGAGCHFLLQGIFPTQGLDPHPLHCRWSPASQSDSLLLSHQRSPCKCLVVIFSHREKGLSCPLHFRSGVSVPTYPVLLPGCGDKVVSGDTLSPASCVILLCELVKRLGGLLLETFLVLGCSH